MLNQILQVQILTFSRLKALTQEGECTRIHELCGSAWPPESAHPPTHYPTAINLVKLWVKRVSIFTSLFLSEPTLKEKNSHLAV
jgi:hypothetical protein